MKRVTVKNYREDRMYPRIVRAFREILLESEELTPVAVLIRMQLLSETDLAADRDGRGRRCGSPRPGTRASSARIPAAS